MRSDTSSQCLLVRGLLRISDRFKVSTKWPQMQQHILESRHQALSKRTVHSVIIIARIF